MPRLERLRQRKLIQWTVAYLAGAWVLLQVLEFMRGQFDWPTTIVPALTVFLAVLVRAWAAAPLFLALAAAYRRVRIDPAQSALIHNRWAASRRTLACYADRPGLTFDPDPNILALPLDPTLLPWSSSP